MKKKYVYIFMQLFTSICLVSVGFASWTFVSGDSITATGNIYAEDVHNYEDFITFDPENPIQGFKYCSGGFLDDNYKIVEYGECIVNLDLKVYNCSIQYAEYNSLKIELEFKYQDECDYNIFNNTIENVVILSEGIEVVKQTPTSETTYKMSFILKNYITNYKNTQSGIQNEDIIVKIRFYLGDDYANAYDYFKDMEFECVVKLEGVNYEEN